MDTTLQKANGHAHWPPSGPNGIAYTIGRHSALIDSLDTRVAKLEATSGRPFPWKDLLPAVWAAIIFLLIAAGKVSLSEALPYLGRG